MTRVRLLLFATVAAMPVAVALAAAPVVVNQVHRAFSVREVRIGRGSAVRFVNADEFIHHVYVNSPGFKFSSDEQPPGQTIDIVFPTEGTFDVRCEIHPKMLLRVMVESP